MDYCLSAPWATSVGYHDISVFVVKLHFSITSVIRTMNIISKYEYLVNIKICDPLYKKQPYSSLE